MNVKVPIRTASSGLEQAVAVPEPHVRAENVPVASCTTSTLTVSTNPVSAAIAPTIAASSVVAVDGEYSQKDGTFQARSGNELSSPSTAPATAPISGSTQRLPVRYCRRRNEVLQDGRRLTWCSETSYCRAIATRTSSSASIR